MGTYFLDSSAILKRYVAEQGSAWIKGLCDPLQGHDLYISQIALQDTPSDQKKLLESCSHTLTL